jgi:hypothetical protein
MLSLGRKFLSHVIPGVIRPLRILWNEMVGFVFLCLAIISAPKTYQAYQTFNGEPQGLFRLLLTGLFFVTMLGFGVSSFLRARKISRS